MVAMSHRTPLSNEALRGDLQLHAWLLVVTYLHTRRGKEGVKPLGSLRLISVFTYVLSHVTSP